MKPVILACEDSPVVQMILKKSLEIAHSNNEVIVVENGQQAKEVIATRNLALFITDILLPDCSGVELVQLCRQKWNTLPIVAMSALFSKETMHDLKVEKVNIVLVKPIKAEVFNKILQHFELT